MKSCAGFISVLLLPLIILYQGWALWLLWNWFAVPLVSPITWRAAVGMTILIGYLKMYYTQEQKNGKTDLKEHLWSLIGMQVAVLVMVGIGWVFHAVGFGG
jgi:hypothetical protein